MVAWGRVVGGPVQQGSRARGCPQGHVKAVHVVPVVPFRLPRAPKSQGSSRVSVGPRRRRGRGSGKGRRGWWLECRCGPKCVCLQPRDWCLRVGVWPRHTLPSARVLSPPPGKTAHLLGRLPTSPDRSGLTKLPGEAEAAPPPSSEAGSPRSSAR